MNTQTNLQRWERHAEWPLAAAALLFLGVYSVLVLTRPQGRESHVLWAVTWIIWGMFILDYVARLCLASDRARWFFRHLLLIYVASLAVFDKERYQSGATINSFTVGYGDVYPVTNTGRVIAVLLMIGGISLVGVVTASPRVVDHPERGGRRDSESGGNRCPYRRASQRNP
jgi:voltage-gated potassium channel